LTVSVSGHHRHRKRVVRDDSVLPPADDDINKKPAVKSLNRFFFVTDEEAK
jgi:hypothetical protein